jgi:hypothetical protein
MRKILAEAKVPGSPIVITVTVIEADATLAKMLNDKPGQGRWVDQYEAKCEANGVNFVGPSTMSLYRSTEDAAREAANSMWSYAVSQRDKVLRSA